MRSALRVGIIVLLLAAFLITAIAEGQQLEPAVANDLAMTRVVQNLSEPTGGAFLPDGRMVIIERGGAIKLWNGSGEAVLAVDLDVDDSYGERGLLGLAIDPEFATSNRLYIYYSASGSPANDRNRVAHVTLDPATNTIDPATKTDIVTGIYGPANHDGGGIVFGPDGYLYFGAGDTGCNCNCSPGTNTQNFFATCLTNLNGKIGRVDREGGIPATNPLVGVASVPACGAQANCQQNGARKEPDANDTGAPNERIYNWGFRNPWRFSFDSQTGFLWIGDVGEVTNEEITVSKGPGEHHGWPFREGAAGQDTNTCPAYTSMSGNCVEPAYVLAQSEAPNTGNGSITGGVFSNHCSWPVEWRGRYWFADYVKNRVWTLTPNQARDGVDGNSRTTVVRNAAGPVHFFNSADGAVYFTSIEGGSISRIVPANPVQCMKEDAGVQTFPDATVPPPEDSGIAGFPDATTPPPADSGVVTPVADAGVVAPADAGGGGGGGGEEEDSGCGCGVPRRHRAPVAMSIVAIAALGALMYSRRRKQ